MGCRNIYPTSCIWSFNFLCTINVLSHRVFKECMNGNSLARSWTCKNLQNINVAHFIFSLSIKIMYSSPSAHVWIFTWLEIFILSFFRKSQHPDTGNFQLNSTLISQPSNGYMYKFSFSLLRLIYFGLLQCLMRLLNISLHILNEVDHSYVHIFNYCLLFLLRLV